MKKNKVLITLMACAATSIVAAIGLGGTSVSASADSTYHYWHISEGSGTYAVSLNTQASDQASGYIGIETKVTRADSTVENLGVTLNGLVEPLWSSGDTGKELLYFDYKTFPAEAIAITYTSSVDCTKQVSVIANCRDNKIYYTVALTDDIVVKDGYSYVEGAKTVGASDFDANGVLGYSTDTFEKKGQDVITHIGRANGFVYIDNAEWTKIADLNDEAFLSASKAGLPENSKYADRYTVESVNELIELFDTKGAVMSVTYYGLNADTVDFHLRGYTGHTTEEAQSFKWIDAGGQPLYSYHTRPAIYQKTTEVYKYATYNVQDLIGAHTFDAEIGGIFTGSDGCDASGSGGTSFDYEDNAQITFGTTDKYVSVGGRGADGNWASGKVYKFTVVDSTPVISAADTQDFVSGVKYNLTAMFDAFVPVGGATTAVYKVDGSVVANAESWTMDGERHTVTLELTDKAGQTGTASFTAVPFEIQLTNSVTLTQATGDKTYFSAPTLPSGFIYTVALYDAAADVATATPYTNNVWYSFTQSGNYKVVYTMTVEGLDEPIEKIVPYSVTVVERLPEISVPQNYKQTWYVGQEISIAAATADTGANVLCELFKNGSSVKTGTGAYVLAAAGEYELVYSVTLGDGRRTEEKVAFTVIQDTEKPVLIVDGTYASSYKAGTVISLLKAMAVDNDAATVSVAVYCDGEQITVDGGEFALTGKTYKIVYSAVDDSGNQADEKVFEFTVEAGEAVEEEKSGCKKGCKSSITSLGLPVGLALMGLALLRWKRKSNEEE